MELRQKILKVKQKPEKEKPLSQPPKVTTRNEYMNNCMFWINEFEAGRTGRIDLVKSATYLRDYCNQIIKENFQP